MNIMSAAIQALLSLLFPLMVLMGTPIVSMANNIKVIQYAHNPSYDSIAITPNTWERIDLVYTDIIQGQQYTNTIQLLRPIKWIKKHHMDRVGRTIHLSMPEFGVVGVSASIVSIGPATFDSRVHDWSQSSYQPVIGKLKRYVTNVRTYTFKDGKGRVIQLNVTPNHPFYVQNEHGFIAIGDVKGSDELVNIGHQSSHGDSILHLVCANKKNKHCGVSYESRHSVVEVYNLEIYRGHTFGVGKMNILVHNGCHYVLRGDEAQDMIRKGIRERKTGGYGDVYITDNSKAYKVFHRTDRVVGDIQYVYHWNEFYSFAYGGNLSSLAAAEVVRPGVIEMPYIEGAPNDAFFIENLAKVESEFKKLGWRITDNRMENFRVAEINGISYLVPVDFDMATEIRSIQIPRVRSVQEPNYRSALEGPSLLGGDPRVGLEYPICCTIL